MPIAAAESVRDALAFSAEEREILKDVRDGDGQLDTPALYVLLRRAAMLPAGQRTLTEAEEPNPKSLWTEPQRYRARLVRVSGRRVGPVEDWSDQVTPTRWWGSRGVHVLYLKVPGAEEPLMVYVTARPAEKLPERVRIAGLFYKLVTLPERAETGDPSRTHAYPVLVAGTVHALRSPWGVPAEAAIMLGVVLALVVVFMLLRRAGRRAAPAERAPYRPRRPEHAADAPTDTAGQPPDEVDAELRRQVEQFRRQKDTEPEGEDDQDTEHPR